MSIKVNFAETFKDVFADVGRIQKYFEANKPKRGMDIDDIKDIEEAIQVISKRIMGYSAPKEKMVEWFVFGAFLNDMWQRMIWLHRLLDQWVEGYHGKLPKYLVGAWSRLEDFCALLDPEDNYYHREKEEWSEILEPVKHLLAA